MMSHRALFVLTAALALGLPACEGPGGGIPSAEREGRAQGSPSEPFRLPAQRAAAPTDEVLVFFTLQERPRPVRREVPHGDDLLRAALEELLAGPTPAEQAAGLTSFFSPATAGALRSVRLDVAGNATVDLADFSRTIPNASTSAGSFMLLGELNSTVFQFPQVRSVEYRFEGDCDAFWNWLQRGCERVTREEP